MPRATFDIPIGLEINPDAGRAMTYNLHWMRRFGLISDGSAERRYLENQVADAVAFYFPYGSGDYLDLCCDILGWFFVFDDQFDTGGFDTAAENTIVALEALTEGAAASCPSPLVHGFRDCWLRSTRNMSAAWRRRARISWTQYFASYRSEAVDRLIGSVLSPEDLLLVRRKSVGTETLYDLAELSCGEVPPLVWHSSLVHSIRNLVTDIIIGVQDVYSLDKEIGSEARLSNLVVALATDRAISLDDAVRLVVDRAGEQCRALLELTGKVPRLSRSLGLSEAESDTVARYLGALLAFTRGNYEWHRFAGRYRSAEPLALQNHFAPKPDARR
ncbi:hypothetical protein [Nocardia sp. N2S4-5]|uniref:terpene synthase family protein n=1 Tax=Nocardia sp. N2S4-5 TaxID=3351565 RepID=UPI0037D12F13